MGLGDRGHALCGTMGCTGFTGRKGWMPLSGFKISKDRMGLLEKQGTGMEHCSACKIRETSAIPHSTVGFGRGWACRGSAGRLGLEKWILFFLEGGRRHSSVGSLCSLLTVVV